MRQVDPEILKERKHKILQAVIHHFIKTARPVGSSVLTEDYQIDLSPATIRSLMAELEEEGYLTHPHTSAGRVPTDKGYRTYVNSLMDLQRLAIDEEDRIRKEYEGRMRELEEVLVQTSRILSGMSQYGGFIVTPKQESNHLKHIELISLAENRILAILVTQTGMVKHKMLEASIPRARLNELSRYLTEKLAGMTLAEARRHIVDAVRELELEERDMLRLAQNMSRYIFEPDENIYIEGTSNVLSLPEFHDYEPMRSLLRLNEDKDRLMHLLEENINTEGVQVIIGSESSYAEFKDLSLVTSVYKEGDSPVGVLGIIGPKRMEYPKMMVLVETVSRIVNTMLSRMGGHDDKP